MALSKHHFNKDESKNLGLLHLYIGSGVGKSTRSIGLAIRAAGNGLTIDFIQFMKSGDSGEITIFNQLSSIRYRCPGKHPFLMSGKPKEIHLEHAQKGLEYAWEAVNQGTEMLICDEILDTILYQTLSPEEVLSLARACKGKIELVMTGRRAPEELMEMADYVTEFVEIKHPYQKEILARKGIEY
jgi:cob(I)alamin adenosyltransferase